MFDFLRPRHVVHARAVLKNSKRILDYRRDLLPTEVVERINAANGQLAAALRGRDRAAVESAAAAVESVFDRSVPLPPPSGWRENTEVFVVAIVVALGVRTFILQPFTIPTGSMQPTLNGVRGYPQETAGPNPLVRGLELAWFGRTYLDAVSREPDVILSMKEVQRFRFFTFTEVSCERQRFTIHAPLRTLQEYFGVRPGREYRAGEPLARGFVEAGDQVLVDKASYYFRRPRRGEVFVFNTEGIKMIERNLRQQGIEGSQFYIKRLAGLPGDKLRIDPPRLFVNGAPAAEPGLARVVASENGYRGYGNASPHLPDGTAELALPPRQYFALGDNSYNSLDGRYWGTVAERNLTGTGVFVYWPFGRHWGFIR
jgi:signal peptidase I